MDRSTTGLSNHGQTPTSDRTKGTGGRLKSRRRSLPISCAPWLALFAFGAVPAFADAPPPKPAGERGSSLPTPRADRWTGASPDEMVENLLARAKAGGDDALAAIVAAYWLEDRAEAGKVRAGLEAIAAGNSPIADDARWLARRLEATPAPIGAWKSARDAQYDVAPDATGLVKSWAVLGPFQDTGGGLFHREGPEAAGERWQNAKARYAWGTYDVAWRRALPDVSTARGLPLDLYIHPRAETCSYVATKVTFPAGSKAAVVHVAVSGAVRLIWDGADVTASEDTVPRATLDRMAAKIDAPAGEHLVALKICSGSIGDDGRVRVRFTDDAGHPIALASSSDLSSLKLAASVAPKALNQLTEEMKDAVDAVGGEDDAKAKGKKPAKGATKKADAKKAPAKPTKDAKAPKKSEPTEDDDAMEYTAGPRAAIVPPSGVSLVKSAVERALDVGASPDPLHAMSSAILRVFGGLEDSRSPRAPGLLDRVTSDAKASADTLAMAGYVSPFGANRSGWLNLAHARARKEGDTSTLAFTQRRLVLSHLNTRYIDWAQTMSHEEPLRSATDADARLIRALIKRGTGGTGLWRATLDDLLSIDSDLRDKTPAVVVGELLDQARSEKELETKLNERVASSRPESRGGRYCERKRTGGAVAYEQCIADNLAHFTSADEVLRAGQELHSAGRDAWSREVFYYGTLVGPNKASAHEGLAAARQSLAQAETHAGKQPSEPPALALADLTRARDLDPGDNQVKAELAFRTSLPKEGATSHEVMPDEQYIPKPEVFLARARQNPAKKGEIADRQLHWVRVVTYHADKRVSQLMHYAREIVIEPRTQSDNAEMQIPAEGADTELLFARLHRKDGTVVQPEEMGSGGRRPYVRWPELHTGDVVEVAVRSWTDGPVGRRGDAPFYFIDYVGSTDTHPILYNEVVVDSPKVSPLAIDVLNGKAEKVETKETGDRKVTRFVWDHPPVVTEEPLSPKLSEVLPVVVGSTFAGWGEFREWYREAVKGFTEPDEQVRRKVAEVTKDKKTREEKLQAIFEFVSDTIKYKNYTSGEWWLPNRPQYLLDRCEGDCDDKAMLLITMLRVVGIEATEVLVQTRYTGSPSLLRSTKVAVPMFDHGIAFLPGKGKQPGIWLDATSPESRLGPLPSMDARAVAMYVHDGEAKIIDTPSSSPDEHGFDATWSLVLDASGGAELIADERHTGDSAFMLRTALKQADARAQWVQQYLSQGWFSTVELTGEVDFSGDLAKGQAQLGYSAHATALARREGNELAVPVGELSPLTSQLAPLTKRTLPVVLPTGMAPGHQTHTITIYAPEGFSFGDLPPNGSEAGGEFGKASLEFTKLSGNNAVVVKRSVVLDMSTIPVEKYEKWREWLQRIDGMMHRMVRLVPDAKAKAGVPPKKKEAKKVDAENLPEKTDKKPPKAAPLPIKKPGAPPTKKAT